MVEDPTTPPPSARADLGERLIIALLGALLSVAVSGFLFGADNNVFHLPIVDALYDEPAFAHDPFIQSLRFYASGLWLALRGVGRSMDPFWLFLGLHIAARFLAFVGFLACADCLGLRTREARALFAAMIALTPLLLRREGSYAGIGDLFSIALTHTSFTLGLTLLMLASLARGHWARALGLNGVVFFFTPFVAVWNIVPLALVGGTLARQRWRTKAFWGQTALGLSVALACAVPVLVNVGANPEVGAPLTFDYVAYLKEYFPFHFLFLSSPLSEMLALATVFVLAGFALTILKDPARPFLRLLGAYGAVYGLGIVLPWITSNPLALNLHLLRVGAFLHVLAVLGGVAVATRWLLTPKTPVERSLGALLGLSMCAVNFSALVLAPLVVILSVWRGESALSWAGGKRFERSQGFILFMVLTCLPVVALFRGLSMWQEIQAEDTVLAKWATVGTWARAHTPPEAVFLVELSSSGPWFSSSLIFEHTAHRSVWVDTKRGAAVMWSPSYYPIWRQRLTEVQALRTHDERLAYARQHNLAFVIDFCGESDSSKAVFQTKNLCVSDAR